MRRAENYRYGMACGGDSTHGLTAEQYVREAVVWMGDDWSLTRSSVAVYESGRGSFKAEAAIVALPVGTGGDAQSMPVIFFAGMARSHR